MPALTGVMHRLAGRPGDRGAVAVTVSLLLGSGVLLGFLALVVDVGQIYVERAQLQTSADAAALGVAKVCAQGAAQCDDAGSIRAWAQDLADANADDGVTRIDEMCGRLDGILDDCSPDAGNVTRCLGNPPADPQPYVEVRVRTELPDGRFVLPPTFAQAMAGTEGYHGTAVAACARASWEITSRPVRILAITISLCEFNDDTNDGSSFGDREHPWVGDERVIQFWDGGHGGCGIAEPPWDEPAKAAFLDGGGSDCERDMPANGIVTGDYSPRIALQVLPSSCEDRIAQAIEEHEVVYLPVHDGVDVEGGDTEFRHTFIVPFLPTGYEWGPPPPYEPSQHYQNSELRDPPSRPCIEEFERCLSGLFVGPPIPLSGVVEDRIVRLIG